MTFDDALQYTLNDIALVLKDKNEKYGNSALDPVRIFSRADRYEQLRVRIDDKLSRIRTSGENDTEDAIFDLLGYLVLWRVGEKMDASQQMEMDV